jgi:hypothetical protein
LFERSLGIQRKGADKGEGDESLFHIVSQGFPDRPGITGIIQNVVDNLERHPDVLADTPQPFGKRL